MARGTFTTANYFTHTGITTTAGEKLAFSLWVRRPSGSGLNEVIMGVRQGDSGAGNFTQLKLEDSGGSDKCVFIHDTFDKGSSFVFTTTVIDDDTWKHIFCYYNGTRLRIYVNGTFEADNGADKTTNLVTTGNSWSIGRRGDVSAESYGGYVAEVGIWKGRTFSESEIAALGKGFSPIFYIDGLQRYYSLVSDFEGDVKNSANLTENGTIALASHPRIIRPTKRSTNPFTAVDPPVVSATLNYRMMMGVGM